MPTLRDEAERHHHGPLFSTRNGYVTPSEAWDAGWRQALMEYGDYEVVEGTLCRSPAGAWGIECGDRLIHLGCPFDHIKVLLLPVQESKKKPVDSRADGCPHSFTRCPMLPVWGPSPLRECYIYLLMAKALAGRRPRD